MPAAPRLLWQVEEHGEFVLIRLNGVIDETAGFSTCLSGVRGKRILVDANKVTRINSFGVRHWMAWVRRLEQDENQLLFLRLRPAVVGHVNAVEGFLGSKGSVVSFWTPFYCGNCLAPSMELLQATEASEQISSARPCATCGEAKQIDESGEGFFGFLKHIDLKPMAPEWVRWLGDEPS